MMDDQETLDAIGHVRGGTYETFILQIYLQLSFSEELVRKGTGLFAAMFQPPGSHRGTAEEPLTVDTVPRRHHAFMYSGGDRPLRHPAAAPASEGDSSAS